MKSYRFYIILLSSVLFLSANISLAQVESFNQDTVHLLYRKEHSFSINLNTQGEGVGFRSGHNLTGYKRLMYDFTFDMIKDPKEIKSLYQSLPNSKSYIFGKLNYFFILRAGEGIQKVINSKPSWGGIEVRYFYFAGIDLGFTKPVYLYIMNNGPTPGTYVITTERYDPTKDDIYNIYGRAPFTDGLDKMQVYPGVFGKFGFNFEFGKQDEKTRSLELGVTFDAFPKAIPIMANDYNNNFFFTVYISYNFGRRKID